MQFLTKPLQRVLRGYAFDPGFSSRLDSYRINEVSYEIPWEALEPGPIGEYLEVIDYDSPSDSFYAPVDLDHPYLLAQNGLPPSDGNPQFHQQFVYAVCMKTIAHFEKALGRPVQWAPRKERDVNGNISSEYFIRRIRVYPHGLRMRNAYYSPVKLSLLFGYFQAGPLWAGSNVPDTAIFSCLSPDIVAHELTHAILDGMHPRYRENTNLDVLAFHEAFADIVALLQRFTFKEIVENQIALSRGDLRNSRNVLGELATQFGEAVPGNRGALRKAIGEMRQGKDGKLYWKAFVPKPQDYQSATEVHDRGAVLVATLFDAMISLYEDQTRDLIRIASEGTGILRQGDLPIDLVRRLALEVCRIATHLLSICITALDYCPPFDITFGEFLRALITADFELSPNDEQGMRLALMEAFRRRGIKPDNVVTYSVDSLKYTDAEKVIEALIPNNDPQRQLLLEYLGNVFIETLNEKFIEDFLEGLNQEDQNASEIETQKIHRQYLRPGPCNEIKYPTALRALKKASSSDTQNYRYQMYQLQRLLGRKIHDQLTELKSEGDLTENMLRIFGLQNFNNQHLTLSYGGKHHEFTGEDFKLEVHNVFPLQRVGSEGKILNQVVIRLTQSVTLPQEWGLGSGIRFRGGCTLILDLDTLKIRYVIGKSISNQDRLKAQLDFQSNPTNETALAGLTNEIFAIAHMH